jgi:hypothetical protein
MQRKTVEGCAEERGAWYKGIAALLSNIFGQK